MKIYLLGQLLVQSQFFENPFKEMEKREKEYPHDSERDWNIALWNCEERLIGEAEEVDKNSDKTKMIEVYLLGSPFKKWEDEYKHYNVSNPEKILEISGYNSLIETSREKIWDIARQLEKAEIDYLIGHNGIPSFREFDYASRNIQEKIRKKFDVEKIEL